MSGTVVQGIDTLTSAMKGKNDFSKKILVGISATMCHSAEKIPAKEGCQYTRVST